MIATPTKNLPDNERLPDPHAVHRIAYTAAVAADEEQVPAATTTSLLEIVKTAVPTPMGYVCLADIPYPSLDP